MCLRWMMPVLMLSLISGCATSSGNYCDLGRSINPSRSDVLTKGTKEQIVENNKIYASICK